MTSAPEARPIPPDLVPLRLTDTHCHLNLDQFDADREQVLERAASTGVVRILVPGLDARTSQTAVALAGAHSSVFAAVGLHPTELDGIGESSLAEISRLATNRKVVAIGEVGLDYYWVTHEAARAHQRGILKRQLDLARDLGRPVVLHMRESLDREDGPCAENLLTMLQDWVYGLQATRHPLHHRPGVLHSFSGSPATAQRAVELGFYIGITGPATYKNAAGRRRVIAGLPLERLLIETDAPFLAPEPHRGQRNEPAFVAHIADKIAEIHSRPLPEIAAQTTSNAGRLFAWGEST